MKDRRHSHKAATAGFTVIELLVVVSIIAILLTFVVPMGSKAKQRARIARARAEIASLETAISAYYSDMGAYPTDRDPSSNVEDRNSFIITRLSGRTGGTGSWDAIRNNSNWYGPYMEFDEDQISGGEFVDPWNTPYVIYIALDNIVGDGNEPSHNELSFDIASYGPDKSSGGGDDITNY